jgi:Green fluorescent protein
MSSATQLSGTVFISGVINDCEFSADGEASGDPATGDYKVHLDYKSVPKGWDPLMYTDVKVSLVFLKEEGGGKNFLAVTGGRYTSAGSIDFDDGNYLRNHTTIEVEGNRIKAVYVMHGSAKTGALATMEFFEETMIPFGPGRIAAVGLARWKAHSGELLDAIFSTRYDFDKKFSLAVPQVRRIEAQPTFDKSSRRFSSSYRGKVAALPGAVRLGVP